VPALLRLVRDGEENWEVRMPGCHPRLPAAWRNWVARAWPFLVFLAAFGLLWRYLPARPLVTVVHPEGPAFPSFTPDGTRLLAQPVNDASLSGRLRVWELPTGRDVTGPLAEYRLGGLVARPLPHGELLLVTQDEQGSKRCALRLVELATGRERLRLDGGRGCRYDLSADGRKLAWAPGGAGEPAIEVWDLSTCCQEARLGHGELVGLSPDGRTLVCRPKPPFSGRTHVENLELWDVARGRNQGQVTTVIASYSTYWARFCPDGHTLAIEGQGPPGGFLKLWDLDAGQERAALPRSYRFAFIRHGCVLAATGFPPSFGNHVRCWDVATARELDSIALKVSAGKFSFASLQASPDGRMLAVETTSEDPGWQFALPLPQRRVLWRKEQQALREIKLFDAATGRELAALPASYMERYTFSPDGSLLAVAREDGRIDVWQVPPRRPVLLAAALAGLLAGGALLLRRWWRKRGTARKRAGANESPPPHKERLLSQRILSY
jgi:hypothetical protein